MKSVLIDLPSCFTLVILNVLLFYKSIIGSLFQLVLNFQKSNIYNNFIYTLLLHETYIHIKYMPTMKY